MENIDTVQSSQSRNRTGTTGGRSTEKPWVTGLFTDREQAEQGYQTLTARGYEAKDINVVMSDDTRKRYFASGEETELGTKAAKGAGVGGAIGGTVGAIAAAIAAVGTSIAIPGLGLVIAGPLAAALAGAGAGGATGGLVGALIGAGIPEERVKHYEKGIKSGGILMGVRPRSDDDAGYLEREWNKAGGTHVYR
ncbi:MAG TPA: hypothetical protein VML92_01420 [Steroidobacteraceae bacterium]|nr:hypothetical protein [Steroidobacteraceae bacterium]